MPTYWPKYHEALAELAWVRKECTELDYGLCSSVASLIFWWLLWMSTDFINSAGNVPQWKMALHMNIWNKNGHLCYAVLMSGILEAISWNLLLVHLRVNKIWQNAVLISGAGTRGIQTVVISLLVHRPLHRHKGILSLFAVNDTHQTVIVHMVSDYFKHQFWRDWNYPKEYKGESTSHCPRSHIIISADASPPAQGSSNAASSAGDGPKLNKLCSVQNCPKGERLMAQTSGCFGLTQGSVFLGGEFFEWPSGALF